MTVSPIGSALTLAVLVCACGFDSELAPRVAMDIVVDGSQVVGSDTDLGYHIALDSCRIAMADIELTTEGEMHASLLRALHDLVVPTAHAHPGHYGGGEIVGELLGRFVFDWRADDGMTLGTAELLEATYTGANFSFIRAEAGDGIAPDDPLVGHSLYMSGTASRDGTSWTFEGYLDQDDGRQVVGAPFDLEVRADTEATLGMMMFVIDPTEQDTLFDGIEFADLDDDGDGHVELVEGSAENNLLRRTAQTHDHYGISHR